MVWEGAVPFLENFLIFRIKTVHFGVIPGSSLTEQDAIAPYDIANEITII